MTITRKATPFIVAAALAGGAVPATASAARQFEGTVVSVNRDARTFRLHDAQRGTKRIKVTSNTRFHRIAGFAALEEQTKGRPRRVLGIDASATIGKTRDQVARIARNTGKLIELGRSVGLTDASFADAVKGRTYTAWATDVTDKASARGVTGTPTVLVAGKAVENLSAQALTAAAAAAGA